MGYGDYREFLKRAGFGEAFGAASTALPGVYKGVTGLTKDLTLLLASVGAVTGVASGALYAKLNRRKLSDLDNAKKMYENERLESDIGYLETKIDQEWAERNRKAVKAKDARLLR